MRTPARIASGKKEPQGETKPKASPKRTRLPLLSPQGRAATAAKKSVAASEAAKTQAKKTIEKEEGKEP